MNFDLRSWPILNTLKPDFILQIHMVLVYGKLANEALIVTKNKMVYGLGNNINGCLGIGDKNAVLEPKKIKVLCGQDIKTFAYGVGPHVLALTKEGNVYSWGDNKYSQLGYSSSGTYKDTPTLVIQDIMNIACGSYYSIALTKDGKIYTWGNNAYLQLGIPSYYDYDVRRSEVMHIVSQPILLLFEKKIAHISCGSTFTIAITENGEVYSCGNNDVGQLGRNNDCQKDGYLGRVDLYDGIVAVKVVCGTDHTLALTDKREIYAWGRNDNGQLGIGNNEKILKPALVKHELEKMKWTDIAALNCSDISIAVDEYSRIYVWGDCRGESILIPTATSFSNVHDAIAYYGPGVMHKPHKPLIMYANKGSDILECLETAFDDPSTSDVKIQVEDQYIHVHTAILKIRSSYFRTMFQHDWAENNQGVIKHDHFSYITYKAFLKYLYTDIVDLPVEKVSELLDLAESYCESNLKQHCIRMMKQEITISNIEYLYTIAVMYSLEELEEFCVKFAINHTKAVTQTYDFAKLIQKMMKTFIMKASEADFKK